MISEVSRTQEPSLCPFISTGGKKEVILIPVKYTLMSALFVTIIFIHLTPIIFYNTNQIEEAFVSCHICRTT
jgi:hypothetical protein